jgi:hypothetical protein
LADIREFVEEILKLKRNKPKPSLATNIAGEGFVFSRKKK